MFTHMSPHFQSLLLSSSAVPCSAVEVYHTVSEQANAEPPRTTQHSRPSTGHEQHQASAEREWEHDPWSGSTKRWWRPTSTAEDHQCNQREEEVQHVQETSHGCHQHHRTGDGDESQQDPIEYHSYPGHTRRGVDSGYRTREQSITGHGKGNPRRDHEHRVARCSGGRELLPPL